MSRALLVYGAFLLLGLGLLGWRLMQMPKLPQGVDDLAPPPSARYEKPGDEELPFPYDLGGKIAAFRARLSDVDGREQQPIFWLKGNLQVITDDDWEDGRPHFQVATLPRPELEKLMDALAALPEPDAGPTILLERRDRDGAARIRSTGPSSLRDAIDRALENKERRPYTPQAVAIAASAAPTEAASESWPLRGQSLARLLTAGTTVLTRPQDVERYLEIAGKVRVFEQGETRASIDVKVLTDRP